MTNTFSFITDSAIITSAIEEAIKSVRVNDTEITNSDAYKKELDKVHQNNAVWKTQLAAIKTANPGIADAVAIEACKQMTRLTGEETDDQVLQRMKKDLFAERKNEAEANAINKIQENAFVAKAIYDSMFPAQQTQVISAPAPAPAPQAPAESRMTMSERKQIIREMVGSGTGTSQFRRHCSTTSMANEARAKIEQWRSLGYITGGQKAELRAEVNAAAWLGHCGVTATR